MDVGATSTVSAVRPGKSAQSVGHMAKAAVAEAKAAGVEMPKNAQGMAASAIAQGADPASVFAAMVTPEPEVPAEVDTPVAEAPVEGEAPAGGATDPAVEAASDGYAEAADAVAPALQDGAEVALALLAGEDEAA